MSRSMSLITRSLLVVVLAITLTGCGAKDEPVADPGVSETTASVGGDVGTSDEIPPSAAPVATGVKVTSAEWDLVVLGDSVERDAGGTTAPSGKSLLVVEFELTNSSGRPRGIGQVDFELTDTSGGQYAVVPTSGEDFIFNTPQPIEAGETRTIKIAYEIPGAGAQGLILMFEPFVEGGVSQPVAVSLD